MSDNDDAQVGRVLTRREVLALFGAAGASISLAACLPGASSSAPSSRAPSAAPSAAASVLPSAPAGASAALPACIVRPEQTEGPYFVDEKLDRSDITTDPEGGAARAGVPLELAVAVSRIDGTACVPLAGAIVDVWHCDAAGAYSDVQGVAGKWLRGYQVTAADGSATFRTIYPGWYRGRTVHIHFKIRTDAGLEFTSQLYFDDAVSDAVFSRAPYAAATGGRVRNAQDGIYGQGGDQLTLSLTGDPDTGYTTRFAIGLQVS